MTMYKWNKVDPYNLDYIKKQVEAIKANEIRSNEKETEAERETEETRTVADILEEHLKTLNEIEHTLKKIEIAVSKKGWRKFL